MWLPLVAKALGGCDRRRSRPAASLPELGLALTSMVVCCDLALVLKLLTCSVLLNANFLEKENSKLVKWIWVSFVH